MQKMILGALTVALVAALPCRAQDRPDRRGRELQRQITAMALEVQAAAMATRQAEAYARAFASRPEIFAVQASRLAQEAALLSSGVVQEAALLSSGMAQEAALLSSGVVREAALLSAGTAKEVQRALMQAQLAALGHWSHRDDAGRPAGFGEALDQLYGDGPDAAWAPQDPADSVYRAGRELLNGGQYRAAARLFSRIRTESRFERSEYRPAAHYWEAFALSRLGEVDDLRAARDVLARLNGQFANHDRVADAEALAATIQGRLARMGDENAARNVERAVSLPDGSANSRQAQCPDDDIRTAALNALLHMRSENTIPLLQELLAQSDECSTPLRRRAMMMLAQVRTPEARDILIEAALDDPDAEVREQATFWLSQVNDPAAVDALGRILAANPSSGVREKAIFALGQHRSERAAEILRDYALRDDVPADLRRHVVFSLGQSPNPDNAAFLRDLFGRTQDSELKRHIIFAVAQSRDGDDSDWLVDIALDESEEMEVRKQALFMAGQNRSIPTERLIQLYDGAGSEEMRRHVLFGLSQRIRTDAAVVDKLIDIVRSSDDDDLRKQAIFWLQQSGDPRVPDLLLEIIRR